MGACTAFVFAALIEFTVVSIQLFFIVTISSHTYYHTVASIQLFSPVTISIHTFSSGELPLSERMPFWVCSH